MSLNSLLGHPAVESVPCLVLRIATGQKRACKKSHTHPPSGNTDRGTSWQRVTRQSRTLPGWNSASGLLVPAGLSRGTTKAGCQGEGRIACGRACSTDPGQCRFFDPILCVFGRLAAQKVDLALMRRGLFGFHHELSRIGLRRVRHLLSRARCQCVHAKKCRTTLVRYQKKNRNTLIDPVCGLHTSPLLPERFCACSSSQGVGVPAAILSKCSPFARSSPKAIDFIRRRA